MLEGEVADARDDVYAVACIAYVLLTGKHPFRGATALKARTSRLSPDRPGGLDPLDPGQRLIQAEMGRMRLVTQGVDDPDIDAGERCSARSRQVNEIA